jgi:hypothetical protein
MSVSGTEQPNDPVALLDQLERLFIDKRTAISKLDRDALERSTAREAELAKSLRVALKGGVKDPEQVSERLRRVRWQAEAFRVLLEDVLHHVGGVFGAAPTNDTYDRRALRRRNRYASSVAV